MTSVEYMNQLANRLEKQGYVSEAYVTDDEFGSPKIFVQVNDANRFGEVQNIAVRAGDYRTEVVEYYPDKGMEVSIEPM